MRKVGNGFHLTATDLVSHLNCRHLTQLDRAVAEGAMAKPKVWDPLLEILSKRGSAHEQSYIEHLRSADGIEVARIEGVEVTESAVAETLAAMRRGSPVVVQGALSNENWLGRADILRRVDTRPSNFGSWSYEVIDTKLSRETKAGAVLQLCLYSDLLSRTQGTTPEHMYVVAPWSDFIPQRYRFADYSAYFRKVKQALGASMEGAGGEIYPEPQEHCDICRWRETCDKRRRNDDHLCLVAGISKVQIGELKTRGIATLKGLAGVTLPLPWKPDRGSASSYSRIREQARLQLEARQTGERKYELLPVEPGFGLSCLPEPSPGDIFLDFEGDPFVGEHGIEYLFGYLFEGSNGATYAGDWAFTRADEKQAFETFVDFVMDRWEH